MKQEDKIKDKELNIVKKVCAEFNINQKELSEILGVGTSTISDWANGNITKIGKFSLEKMSEVRELKNKLEQLKGFKSLLESL